MITCFSADITQVEKDAVSKVLDSQRLGFGPAVPLFEGEYGRLSKKIYNIGTNSASAAAYLLFQYLYETFGAHRVYTTSLGFASPVFAALKNMHQVILIDVDENLLISTKDFKNKFIPDPITPSVVMPVLYGGVSKIPNISEEARVLGCKVVLDSAHCISPTMSHDYAFYSFHSAKPICMANGGMISTNDESASEYFKLARNFGRKHSDSDTSYDITTSGFNFYMNNLNASMGLPQLKRVDENIKKRRSNFKKLEEFLPPSLGYLCQHDRDSSYYMCTLVLKEGESSVNMRKHMLKRGVECTFHYPPLHETEYYKTCLSFEKLNSLKDRIINLPIHQGLTPEEVDKIIYECIHYSRSRRQP